MRTFAICALLGLFMGSTQALKLQASLQSELQAQLEAEAEFCPWYATDAEIVEHILDEYINGEWFQDLYYAPPGVILTVRFGWDKKFDFTKQANGEWTNPLLEDDDDKPADKEEEEDDKPADEEETAEEKDDQPADKDGDDDKPAEEDEAEETDSTQDSDSDVAQAKQSKAWGLVALKLTNKYRASKGLGPLEWNQELHDIGQPHNVNMGEGVYDFSHEGFDERMEQVSFQI